MLTRSVIHLDSCNVRTVISDVEAYAEYSRELLAEEGSGFKLVSQLLHKAGERTDPLGGGGGGGAAARLDSGEGGAAAGGGGAAAAGGGGGEGGGGARFEADGCHFDGCRVGDASGEVLADPLRRETPVATPRATPGATPRATPVMAGPQRRGTPPAPPPDLVRPVSMDPAAGADMAAPPVANSAPVEGEGKRDLNDDPAVSPWYGGRVLTSLALVCDACIAHAHARAHAHAHANTHTHTHTHARARTHEHTNARTRTRTRARTHIHTHTQMHRPVHCQRGCPLLRVVSFADTEVIRRRDCLLRLFGGRGILCVLLR